MRKKTFTLVEMMIVMVLISIMAAALIPRLQYTQLGARDAKRIVDLKTIQDNIALYHTDKGYYPRAIQTTGLNNFDRDCTGAGNTLCNITSDKGTKWFEDLYGNYLTSVPVDPKNVFINAVNNQHSGPRRDGNYVYAYVSSQSGDTYTLAAQFENRLNVDRCQIKNHMMYDNSGEGFRCFSEWTVGSQADLEALKALYAVSGRE